MIKQQVRTISRKGQIGLIKFIKIGLILVVFYLIVDWILNRISGPNELSDLALRKMTSILILWIIMYFVYKIVHRIYKS